MSEKEDYLNKLSSNSATERHRAARFFCENPSPEILDLLFKRKRLERVMHVKRAIESAINKITCQIQPQEIHETDFDISEDTQRHLQYKAIEEFSSILLHELEPKIGFLKLAAKKEIENFETSKVNYHLEILSGLISAIASLKKASSSPRKREADLVLLLKDTCSEELGGEINYHLEGPEPFLKVCDPDLLKIAISNGVRNAAEALSSNPDGKSKNIVITWGGTEVDIWISILDDGPGLMGTPDSAFLIGNTNKQGHSGFGLAIIKQAMENMDGHVELSNGINGGALLKLRWPI